MNPVGTIWFQRFDAAGAKVGAETRASSAELEERRSPRVLTLHTGGFLVSWLADGEAAVAREFDQQGRAIGSERRLSQFQEGQLSGPLIAAAAGEATLAGGGRAAVAWTADGQDGLEEGVFFQYARVPSGGGPLEWMSSGEKQGNGAWWGTQHQPAACFLESRGAWDSALLLAYASTEDMQFSQGVAASAVFAKVFQDTPSCPAGAEMSWDELIQRAQPRRDVGLQLGGDAALRVVVDGRNASEPFSLQRLTLRPAAPCGDVVFSLVQGDLVRCALRRPCPLVLTCVRALRRAFCR